MLVNTDRASHRRMVGQSTRTAAPLAALLLDLDHFKQINDRYGHGRGDEVLAAAGVVLQGAVRESDFVGRFGGEEFLLLLPATDRDSAIAVAEKIRTWCPKSPFAASIEPSRPASA
jgi:diguanylate cyclase